MTQQYAVRLLQSQFRESQFVYESKRHLSMVDHMVVIQILNKILVAMEMIVTKLEFSFDDVYRRIASLQRGHMIRAAATTDCFLPGDGGILRDVSHVT
jgi:hypothetical protein